MARLNRARLPPAHAQPCLLPLKDQMQEIDIVTVYVCGEILTAAPCQPAMSHWRTALFVRSSVGGSEEVRKVRVCKYCPRLFLSRLCESL